MSSKYLRPTAALLGLGLIAAPLDAEAGPGAKHGKMPAPKLSPAKPSVEMLEPVKLVVPKTVQHDTVVTKKGTKVAVKIYPGPKWTPSPDWQDGGAAGQLPATGEVVLVAFAGDGGASVEPLVQMLQAMGSTVVTFKNPLFAFDNPAGAFDNPLVAFDNPAGAFDNPLVADGSPIKGGKLPAKLSKLDTPIDLLHAVLTWTAKNVATDGRVNLYGAGVAANIAFGVGAQRSDALWSVIVDGASPEVLERFAPDYAKAGADFEGFLVLGAQEQAVAKVEPVGARAELSIATPKALAGGHSLSEAVIDGVYQKAVATYLNSDVLVANSCPDDPNCSGLTRSAGRTVLRLEA